MPTAIPQGWEFSISGPDVLFPELSAVRANTGHVFLFERAAER
jgi:hypothetical protein